MTSVTGEQGVEYTFPAALPGFPDCRRLLVQRPAGCEPLIWLVSLDHADLAFAAVEVDTIVEGYRPRFSREDLADLSCADQADLVTLVLLTVPDGGGDVTANLRAPLIINPETGIGRQAILSGQEYSARHRLSGGTAK
jgi:flagellar assembly factor FliW